MNSLPKLAEESILAKQQAEQNLSSFLDQNFSENSSDFLQLLRSYPTLETIGKYIVSFLDKLPNETFTISHQKLINRSLSALLSEFSKISKNSSEIENSITTSNIEFETIKDKLNDSLIQIQTLKSSLQKKDEIIDQLNSDNNELEKNIVFLKEKILKKKEKIEDLKLKNRQININLEEKKISIINQSLNSTISSLSNDGNYEKLFDEICSLSNTIKFNDFEYKKLLESNHYCLNICRRLLDLAEEYENRLSMVEEDKAVLYRQLSHATNENFSLRQSINASVQNETLLLSEIDYMKTHDSKESNEQKVANNNINIIPDTKLRNEVENLYDIIKSQKSFIATLSNYINRLLIDGDNYIPLLYESNQIIKDNSLRQIIIDSVESIKTELFINDYFSIEDKKDINSYSNDLRNQFFTKVFGPHETLEQFVDNYIKENNDKKDNREIAVLVALCTANINLGSKFSSLRSHLTKIYSRLPQEYQKDDLLLSFQNFLSDSLEIIDKFHQINNTSSFFNFKSDEIKTTIFDIINVISKFISILHETVYPVVRYNKNDLTELPTTLANSISILQSQNNDLKTELQDYKIKYQEEFKINNSQQKYADEISIKMKEKDRQIKQYINSIQNKYKEFQDFKISSELKIKEKDSMIKNYETEISKIQKENETNLLLLKNTKKLYKSQIDNVVKIEKDKKDKEIKELKQINSENEQVYMQKLESKKKKVKTLQSQIKEITRLYEKKIKKNSEAAENLLNETNEQINLIEETFKQKEKQYQNEIEILKEKLLEEVQQNSAVKIIEVPAPSIPSFDKNANNDIFIKQIVNILSDFPSSNLNSKMADHFTTEIVQSKILLALQQLSNEVKNNHRNTKTNETLDNSSSTIMNIQMTNSISSLKSPIVGEKRVVNTRDLRMWESWAVDIAITMNVPTNSFAEIRTAIRDIILSQKSKSLMLRNVQSLRIQKKLLIENNLFNLKFSMRQNISLKGIIFFYISASCMSKTCKAKGSRSQII